jgi:hypothetical protein
MAFCQKETEAHVEQDCRAGDEIPGRSWEDHGKIPIFLGFWIVLPILGGGVVESHVID